MQPGRDKRGGSLDEVDRMMLELARKGQPCTFSRLTLPTPAANLVLDEALLLRPEAGETGELAGNSPLTSSFLGPAAGSSTTWIRRLVEPTAFPSFVAPAAAARSSSAPAVSSTR